jgi:peptide/nickel transport system permease protein
MRKRKTSFNLVIGGLLVGFFFLMLIVSFFYTPFAVNEMHTTERFLPPGKPYLLGTDNFGRDIFSRIMKGTQTAFLVGAISVLIGLVIGVCLGALSGYFGGWFDRIIAQLNATIQAFPGVLLALMIVAVFGPGTINTIVALSITAIPGFTRITRSGFLQFKEYSFVEAAETIGLGPLSIMIRHILPQIVPALLVAASTGFSSALLAEAGLSYLGLGVQPPEPSWGRMLNEAQGYLLRAPWFSLAPGCVILLAVLGFNLLSDGIRDLLDPNL